ncbi:DUF3325 domain-containing protein [Novosphingobium resinovorum]|uniref:DUF3325 domain-containing protein n=1 Tax=Novosphingobium resinovorum TaxID=158500 RepID=A0A031JUP3_9SPHN|nr:MULTISPECIES: DUF3325 domain-containing protein [Novosphingobium]AOR79455.1 hypothetical protein BES08_21790 [Novosphingobium resinovorum]EZP80609.1 hypothetical protein BV97_03376 [Novosphingobium resinovorum]MBF7013630.1 DUF3325 domain-containing protein [Novosphingobium sp. HR1a]WJM25779.1 DUF3325 domain-containing protein [Novosphingobium resinovorum]
MMHLLPALIAFAGFLALAAAMKRHQRDLLGKSLTEAQMQPVRMAGWLLLGAGWTVSAALLGLAMGTIAWLGELSLGAALTVATLNWRTGRRAR